MQDVAYKRCVDLSNKLAFGANGSINPGGNKMSEKFRALHDMASFGARHERMRATLYGVIAAALVGMGQSADARITQFQITSQTPAFGGVSFGAVGSYETIIGRASGEVDPLDPLNVVITDVQL